MKETKCAWKKLLDCPTSTTAEDVRRTKGYHDLKICLDDCVGYDPECPRYRRVGKHED